MASIIKNLTSGLDLLKYLNPFDNDFILNGVLGFLNPLSDNFMLNGVLSYLNPFSDNFILSGVVNSLGSVLDHLNPFSDNFILKGVLDFLGNILNFINPFSDNFFGYKIIELFSSLFEKLFIPKEDSFKALQEVFNSKLGFIDVIKNYVADIQSKLNDMNNGVSKSYPKLQYDVKSSYYNGSIVVFDCGWIAPYKKYTDLFISGFAYLFFIYRLFKRIPAIVSGNVINGKGD